MVERHTRFCTMFRNRCRYLRGAYDVFYPDDRRAVPPQATDGVGHVRVVDDEVVRKPSGDEQAVVRAVGHVLHALLLTTTASNILYRGIVLGREGEKRCSRIGRVLADYSSLDNNSEESVVWFTD